MEKKNRFSILLERLMGTVNLKNATLAAELQYDVSYISKWINGKTLPSEKSVAQILHVISDYIVESATSAALKTLYIEYQVDVPEDLKQAIYDNLEAEYFYVKGLTKTIGADIAPETQNYAKLTLYQFLKKMSHPALRQVKSLNVIAAIDLLNMEHDVRLQIAQIDTASQILQRDFPEVHFSLLINFDIGEKDYIYDCIFIINMLTNYTHINFKIYNCIHSYDKIVFCAKDAYCITSMLLGGNLCYQVTISEDKKMCKTVYQRLATLCTREELMFRKCTMRNLLQGSDYISQMLSENLCWLLGHMTEHFLPEELHKELLEYLDISDAEREKMQNIHLLVGEVLKKSHVRILLYETALSQFAISGELDFYNNKILLDTRQREQCLSYIQNIIHEENAMELRIIHGHFVMDFQFNANPSLFLSNNLCYLRLDSKNIQNNVTLLNINIAKKMFRCFFEEIWSHSEEDVVISDWRKIESILKHMKQSVALLKKVDKEI